MNAFVAYGISCLVVCCGLARVARGIQSPLLKKIVWYGAATSPLWFGVVGARMIEWFAGGYSKFVDEWTWAWGISNMFLLLPVVLAWQITTAIAGIGTNR